MKQMAEQSTVAACDGLLSARVIGGAIHAAIAVTPGGPVARQSYPLPGGVRVVAISANGQSFVDGRDGACWCWSGTRFVRGYDAIEAER